MRRKQRERESPGKNRCRQHERIPGHDDIGRLPVLRIVADYEFRVGQILDIAARVIPAAIPIEIYSMTFDFDARQFGRMKKGMQHSGVPEVAGPDILHDTTDRTRAPPHRPSLSENIKIIVTFQRRQMFSILLELDREAPLERCDPCLLNPVKVAQAPHRSLAIDPARPAKPLAQSIPERMIAGAQPLRQRIPWQWKGYGDRQRPFFVGKPGIQPRVACSIFGKWTTNLKEETYSGRGSFLACPPCHRPIELVK